MWQGCGEDERTRDAPVAAQSPADVTASRGAQMNLADDLDRILLIRDRFP
jgi:hypothetical protein